MSKSYKIAVGIFLLLIIALTYLEASEPQPLNWSPSYSENDKIPLGTYILFENLKDQPFDLEEVNVPPYEFLERGASEGTYFFLNDQLAFDNSELDRLLNWVSEGNTAFLAAENFGGKLLDTLGLQTEALVPQDGLSFKPILNLEEEHLKNDRAYLFNYESYVSYFSEVDSVEHEILGVAQFYRDTLLIRSPRPNYIRTKFGEGEILLHLTPKAFSNFFLVHDQNIEYAERALAYIPTNSTLYWDKYYKTGKSFYTSPLYILLNNRALKWAYYFALLGSLLFVLFEGKRKQRSIPVIKPLQNQTYHFTRTVAGLYLDRKDYKIIASKKIGLFLDHIRTKMHIPTSEINRDFYQKVAAANGTTGEEVEKIFRQIGYVQEQETITKDQLLKLSSAIDNLKNKK